MTEDIDFSILKYNLYEILGVEPNASENAIKREYMKLVREYHPDRSNKKDEEIYYHIVLANRILLSEKRQSYDDYLEKRISDFNELKKQFTAEDLSHLFPTKDNSTSSFNQKMEELNKKHGYTDALNGNTMDIYQKAKSSRDNDVYIKKENIRNFNETFENRLQTGEFDNQIINYDNNGQLMAYEQKEYAGIDAINKLYDNGTVITSQFSSLDRAFTIMKTDTNIGKKSIEERMKEYNEATTTYDKRTTTTYSTTKFEEWSQ